MPDDLFPALDAVLASETPAAAIDLLIDRLRESGQYNVMFEARLMRKRLELGLPLVQTDPSSSFPPAVRGDYEAAVVEAARATGHLYLAAGNIEGGYRYLHAIGEADAVATAIEQAQPGEDTLESVVAIAFQEGVHPVRGLELILHHHGMCRAITAFGMYAVSRDRDRCIALLVRALHGEVVERMARAIQQQEGNPPAPGTLVSLMQGRDWLFGEYDCYEDTSHLTSVIPYAIETTDRATLDLIADLCAYGRHLGEMYRFAGSPPFEEGYAGYGAFIVGDVEYFRAKAMESPESAQVLVNLLVRLERFDEALDAFLRDLGEEDPASLRCPSALQLAYMAKDYARMGELARQRGDALSFTAATLLGRTPGKMPKIGAATI